MKRRYRSNHNLKKRCACARRSWETCAHDWFANLQWQKRVLRESLGTSDKAEALTRLAERRVALMHGHYVPPRARVAPAVDAMPTFETVAGYYLTQHVEPKLASGAASHHASVVKFLATITVPPGVSFTQKPFRLITQEDVEIAIAAKRMRSTTRQTKGTTTWTQQTGGDIAANRLHGHLAALWSWAIQPKRAYADKTPFSYGGRVPDELKKPKERGRDRRLQPGEEQALLAHAGPHLRDCIVAALETGMRKDEILSLQWKHVRWMQNEIALDWQNTKTKRSRQIPISATLREVLTRRHKAHPKEQPWSPEHYVFGNEIGERVQDIRVAFNNTVLRAHAVEIVRGRRGRVSAENRAKLAEIDLHFHDLRHEAGSRKLEAGWPLHAVSRWLGHTKLTTTDTYLNATTQLLHELNARPLTAARA
jgi:integrase